MKKTLVALAVFVMAGMAHASNVGEQNTSSANAVAFGLNKNTNVNTNVNNVSTKGTVGNVSATGGASSSTATGGSVSGSGNSMVAVSTKGTVGNVSSTTGEINNASSAVGGSVIVEGTNATDLEIARINAQAARDVASTTQVIKNTPSVSGPALTSSNDTCMGSTSGSANAPGIGIGFGTSWVDNNCRMLKNSRELWNMGMKAASLALMCTDAANKEALELTGFVCPQTAKAEKDAKAAAATSDEKYTDPIVRARLGLKPLSVASK